MKMKVGLKMKLIRSLYLMLGSIALISSSGCTHSSARLSSDNQSIDKMAKLQRDFSNKNNGRVFVVAHRGCWTAAPENSIQSMRDCINLGVEVAEIDVHLTKDGELVVFHDRTLERMTNGAGAIRERNLSELKSLQLYERDGSPHQIVGSKILTSHRIPTLRELFEVTRGHLMINLEIKANKEIGFVETYNATLKLAREMGVENEILWKIPSAARTYDIDIVPGFSGSNDPASPADRIVSQIDTEGLKFVTPIVWHSKRSFEQQIMDLADDGYQSFEIVTDNLSYWPRGADGRVTGADRYRYLGVAVLAKWSGGLSDDIALSAPDKAWGELLRLGADSIMTDRPEQLIRYLKENGYR